MENAKFRIQKEEGVSIKEFYRTVLWDRKLSLEAKGFYGIVLGDDKEEFIFKPESYFTPDPNECFYTMLNELVDAGYIQKVNE